MEKMMEREEQHKSMINETFYALNERHNNIYQFVIRYNDYILALHDYGEGIPLTMIEAHILTYIEDHPGVTVTGLTQFWKKTKGALSQTVSRLSQQGLVEKRKENGNEKNLHLYATERGTQVSRAHKLYDTIDIAKTMDALRQTCTPDEIEAFYKVLSAYIEVMKNDFGKNRVTKKQITAEKKRQQALSEAE